MNSYSFDEMLSFSEGVVRGTCVDTIMEMLPGAVSVERAKLKDDKSGVDYWAHLRGGAVVGIDHKARTAGCSYFWKDGEPEFSLEVWSMIPDQLSQGKAGWTLSESSKTQYTLHTYDPSDTTRCFLLPFQLLRVAFRNNVKEWRQEYQVARQSSGKWKSMCVFVPAYVVLKEIRKAMEK